MTVLLHEVAHLSHVELLTPEPERSLWFFTQVLGLTENAAKERGYKVKIGTFPFVANGKARILNLPEGMVKVVAEEKYDEVLGVHIIGPRATELISDACSLLKLETTSEEMLHVMRPHPTLSEALTEAALGVRGKPLHI